MSKAQLPLLSIVISNSPYLSDLHLELQVDALNRQTSKDFQVFYLNQDSHHHGLHAALKQAYFPFKVIDLPFPWLAETCCWDLVSVMGHLFEQDLHGRYMTYLHKECLPAPDFVETTLSGIASAETELGHLAIYRLNQLRCQQQIGDLNLLYPLQLAASDPIYWIARTPFRARYTYQVRAWEEDAFALPVALIREKQLFSCVRFPLFFQDLFDIFYLLPQTPGFENIPFVHLGEPVIYHLNHERIFKEYRQEFLTAIRQQPQLFGHLALYELAEQAFDYSEPFSQGIRQIPAHLHRFVRYMRYSEKGTVTLWHRALTHLAT